MPTPQDVIGALKYASDNFDDPDTNKQRKAQIVANKLGMGVMELKQLRFAMHSPDDERSTPIKNKIFDRVAETQPAMEIKKGGGLLPTERFTVKNLIDEDIGLQKQYLDKKGYQTREVGGVLEVKKPGDMAFQPIDPSGIDRFDMFDIVGDTIKGIAEGIGQGSKALGAGIGGPLGFGIGTAVSGGLSGATETARQAVGIAAGVRPEFNVPLIGKEAATGAVLGGTLKALGAGAKAIGKEMGIAGARDAALKPNAADIKAAAEEIGAIATPGRLSASLEVQKAEDALARSPGFLGLNKTKKAAEANLATEDKVAKEIAKLAGIAPDSARKSAAEAGNEAKKIIGTKIKEKVDTASKIFNEIETKLDRGALKVDLANFNAKITELADDYSMDDKMVSWLQGMSEKSGSVTTVGDLKKFKTAIGNELSRNRQDPALRRSAASLLGELESAKAASFSNAIDKELTKAGWKPGMKPEDMTSKQFKKGADKIAYFRGLQSDLADASKLWREANVELASILKRPGEELKGGATYNLDKLMKSQPEKVMKKVLSSGDDEKLAWMADKYPEAVQAAQAAKVSALRDKIQQKVYGQFGETSTASSIYSTRLVNAIGNLSPADKALVLGVDAEKKYNALRTFTNSKNPLANNSGTAYTQAMQSAWREPVSAFVMAIKQANRLRGESRGSSLRSAGNALTSPVTRGVAGGLIPDQQSTTEQSLIP